MRRRKRLDIKSVLRKQMDYFISNFQDIAEVQCVFHAITPHQSTDVTIDEVPHEKQMNKMRHEDSPTSQIEPAIIRSQLAKRVVPEDHVDKARHTNESNVMCWDRVNFSANFADHPQLRQGRNDIDVERWCPCRVEHKSVVQVRMNEHREDDHSSRCWQRPESVLVKLVALPICAPDTMTYLQT